MRDRSVAVLGATGIVGQRFIRLLGDHPWFRLREVVASDSSRGKRYSEAARWVDDNGIPAAVRGLEIAGPDDDIDAEVVFSALPSGTAGKVERRLASMGYHVFTNAADLRMEPDVPIVVPEVNPDHLALVESQPGDGFVVANGNCTSIILALALKPLMDRFGVDACHVVTLQALSGAGHPGVSGLDSTANVIPYIDGEEEKVETEPQKMLGTLQDGGVVPAPFGLSATCTRVPVIEGHTLAVSVRLSSYADERGILDAFQSFRGRPQELRLPSAPPAPVIYREEPDRPQPRRDASEGDGMAVVAGRLRSDPALGWKFVMAGSNTIRGAAGTSILTAEMAVELGVM